MFAKFGIKLAYIFWWFRVHDAHISGCMSYECLLLGHSTVLGGDQWNLILSVWASKLIIFPFIEILHNFVMLSNVQQQFFLY